MNSSTNLQAIKTYKIWYILNFTLIALFTFTQTPMNNSKNFVPVRGATPQRWQANFICTKEGRKSLKILVKGSPQ